MSICNDMFSYGVRHHSALPPNNVSKKRSRAEASDGTTPVKQLLTPGFYIRIEEDDSDAKFVQSPAPMDVVFGRGRWNSSHPGNRRLQILININLDRYIRAGTRKAKTSISQEVVHIIKTCGIEHGRFLRFVSDTNGWETVSDNDARIKVSQAFRYTVRTPPGCVIPKYMLVENEKTSQVSADPSDVANEDFPPSFVSRSISGSESDENPIISKCPLIEQVNQDQACLITISSDEKTFAPRLVSSAVSESEADENNLFDQDETFTLSDELMSDEDLEEFKHFRELDASLEKLSQSLFSSDSFPNFPL